MQTKPNETPKIIGLSIALVIALGAIIFQLVRAMQVSGPPPIAPPVTADNEPSAPGVQIASAANTRPQAGPGQMRYFDDQLDADPPPGQAPSALTGRPDAFHPIKAPVGAKSTSPPVHPPVTKSGNTLPPLTTQAYASLPGPWMPTTSVTQTPTTPAAPPKTEYRLDGVVTGPDGFAMLTIRDSSTQNATGGGQTIYKRVGDRVARHPIVAISDSGITLRGRSQAWLVGQTLLVGESIIAEAPVSPAADAGGASGTPAAAPSPVPAGQVPSPPTQTP